MSRRFIALIGIAALSSAVMLQPSLAAQPPVPYANWPNGPWQNPAFFPIAVWYEQANSTGHSGPYANLAAAAAASGINIFLGQGAGWPEQFGRDNGEFEAILQAGLYLIGGITVPPNNTRSAQSVPSILALAQAIGAQTNLIGYNAGDEPQCVAGTGQIAMAAVPSVVAGIARYDPTRLIALNQTDWMIQPEWQHPPANCLSLDQAALQATGVASFDLYPLTSPYITTQFGVTGSDFISESNDSLWVQGLSVQAMKHFAAQGQPLWAFIEAGGDNFALSEANDSLPASLSLGSTTITNLSSRSHFTSTWIGLAVSGAGIMPNTTISGIIDASHATMSNAAAATSSASVTVGSGPLADCVVGANLCLVNGNEYRPTPADVTAEVWMSIVNGAIGLEYFCHDATSYSFCLGDSAAGGAAATAAQQNLAAIDTDIANYAPVLNAPTVGMCSMQQMNYSTGMASTTTSCADGSLTMASNNSAVPGMALAKTYQGSTFVFAQSDRRSLTGANFLLGVSGLGGHMATVVYDSYDDFDPARSSVGQQQTLNSSGQFNDVLGSNSHQYQMKIYQIN